MSVAILASKDQENAAAISLRGDYKTTVLRFLARYSSPQTRRTYGAVLMELYEYLTQSHKTDRIPLRDISEDDLLSWSQSWQNIQPTTAAKRTSTVRSFFRYAHKSRLVDEDPASPMTPPRLRRSSRTLALSPAECRRILEVLHEARLQAKPNSRLAKSAHLALALYVTLLTTGLRVSEICSLKLGDISWGSPSGSEPPRLTVHRKGGRTQTIYLHETSAKTLWDYVQTRVGTPMTADELPHLIQTQGSSPMFVRSQPTKTTGPLTPKSVWLILSAAAKRAGLSRKVSPHVLRATLATNLHAQGILLHQIQDLLGHSSVSTTSLYVKRQREAKDAPSLQLRLADSIAARTAE